MKQALRRFALLAAAAAALACTQVAAQNFLWQVTSLTNRAYLFGTIHAGKAEWLPLPRAVEEAMDDCGVVVVEADITNVEAMEKSAGSTTYAPPDTLRNHVAPDDYTRFLRLLPRYKLPEAQVVQMKPFMASSLLVFAEWAREGYLPQYGIDGYIIRKARAAKKKVVELEGVDAQVALMDSLTDKQNQDLFSGTLTALESGLSAEQIHGMVRAWQVGDPQAMLEVARRYNEKVKGAADFEEKFVWSRHPAMLKKIDGYLNDSKDRHFIAIGALHLVGPRGLVEELRARGYQVKQLFVAPQGDTPK